MRGISAAIEAIYATVLDHQRWQETLALLAAEFRATGGSFTIQGDYGPVHSRFETGLTREGPKYLSMYATKNVLFQGLARAGVGGVRTDYQCIDRGVLEQSEYFNEYMTPNWITHTLGIVISQDQGNITWMSLNRSRRERPFVAEEAQPLAVLGPHLRRANELSQRLGILEAKKQAAEGMFDGMVQGVSFLDANGKIVFANKVARQLNSRSDGLGIRHDQFHAATSAETTQLQQLITAAIPGDRDTARLGGTMAVARPNGGTSFAVFVAPLPPHEQVYPSLGSPTVAVVVSDPERPLTVPLAYLRQAFGLTTQEAKLASILAGGSDLRAAAVHLNITYETARTHVARVLAKTGVKRQAELVQLVLKSAPAVLAS